MHLVNDISVYIQFVVDTCHHCEMFKDGKSTYDLYHYENMPIQIYWKFYHQEKEKNQRKFWYFFIFLLKT